MLSQIPINLEKNKGEHLLFKKISLLSIILWLLIWSLPKTLLANRQADFISTPSERGSASFHHHLVYHGNLTTYLLRIQNIWQEPVSIQLEILAEKNNFWSIELSSNQILNLAPGNSQELILTIRSSRNLSPGSVFKVKVKALSSNGYEDFCELVAESSVYYKIYFLSIDSLHPDYLKLNALGNGYGKDGDWLMPNLHKFMEKAVFYPNFKVHIITATDMNHFNMLSGTMTGTSGIGSVGAFAFGFDQKGNPLLKSASELDASIALYDQGKQVPSLFNAVKSAHPQAWTAFASGKNWVPEMMRFPEFQIDRIIHGIRFPDWIEPPGKIYASSKELIAQGLNVLLFKTLPKDAHPLGNPANLPEPQDKRILSPLARMTSAFPSYFPPDKWVMDSALREILNEDPDLFYILLAVVDDAGHAYGSAFDLEEWSHNGTPQDLSDDKSKYSKTASRQSILNVVREADAQVGKFLDFLEERENYDNSIIIIESDHNMVTYYRKALEVESYLKKHCHLSMKEDYVLGASASVGMVFIRRDDPNIIPEVEKALEAWRVKNPLTQKFEPPIIVYNQQEMKTGFDQATQKQWMLPNEFYSEYYINHSKPGEQLWPDLLILTASHYELKTIGAGLGNLGIKTSFQIPKLGYFIGGHGNFETRSALLLVKTPLTKSLTIEEPVWAMDIAPTIYRIQGWQIPESVDGKGLPEIDPILSP